MIPEAPPALPAGFHLVPPGHLPAIVTALERFDAPRDGAPPPRDGIKLKRIQHPGIDWYRGLFRRIGEPWMWVSRLVIPEAALAAVLADPKVEIFALIPEGGARADALGLLELNFHREGQCEIAYFGLAPDATGQGLGTFMMRAALHEVFSRPGIWRVWLHTCTLDDPRALPFYQRNGFKIFQRQIEILPDPRLTRLYPPETAPDWPCLP